MTFGGFEDIMVEADASLDSAGVVGQDCMGAVAGSCMGVARRTGLQSLASR